MADVEGGYHKFNDFRAKEKRKGTHTQNIFMLKIINKFKVEGEKLISKHIQANKYDIKRGYEHYGDKNLW